MALKFVGQEIASAVIGLVVEKVPSVLNYFKGKKLNDESLQKLKIMLISANAVLIDAEVKEITNPAVKEWLDELKDAVYDAEDLFDEIATEALRCKIEAESQTGKRKYSDFVNSFDEGLESDLEKILHKLEYITQQKDVLGLKEVAGEVPLPSSRLTTSCPEKCVYGRDLDREVIFKMLQSDDAGGDEICVVPIVGMGGIGKTTLARLLYNDSRVNETFDLKAWNLEIPYEAKGLRTFIGGDELFYSWHNNGNIGKMIDELVQAFKCLRVLSLSNISELPDSVGALKHLRYLDIGDTEIKHLPDSLCSLYNLLVLILSPYITKLPTHMCKLINLRHLDIDTYEVKLEEMPPQMGKLKNLRKLPFFIVGKNGGYNARELGELLRQLSGKLIISNLEYVHCTKDATEVMLKDKQDLSELELKWKYDHDTDDSEKERNEILHSAIWCP
uniref:Rx N-terminal domain-containing protein n=1 Tax=Fagus sylvatica TaxID=28930 RepID=A0A2N9EXY2_FAGSY